MSAHPPEPAPEPTRRPTHEEIVARLAALYAVLFAPDQVVELRALGVESGPGRPHTVAGYFDGAHRAEMVRAALDVTKRASGVYATLNPINPALLARRANRTGRADTGALTKDADATARRWLLVDVDPVRPAGISATDTERAAAAERADAVRAFLAECGWPEPVRADSGNGTHLLYRVDLPADDGGLAKRVLAALAARFDTADAKVDRAVFNAARICKLPGSLARKGDSTTDRPHRRAKVLDLPDPPAVVPLALLEALAAEAPTEERPPTGAFAVPRDGSHARLDVGRWLTDRGVAFTVRPEPEARGRTVYALAACPFDPSHAGPDAAVMQAPDGQLSAHCFHASCTGRGWQQFKTAIGPPESHHYDPPLRPRARRARAVEPTVPTAADVARAAAVAVANAESPGAHEDAHADGASPDTIPPDALPPDVPPAPGGAPAPGEGPAPCGVLIDPANVPVAHTVRAITAALVAAGDCYTRAGQLVRVDPDGTICPALTHPELSGLLNAAAEVLCAREEGTEFRPLPANYAHVWLHHPTARRALPEIALYTRNPVFTLDWRLAPSGYDPDSRTYYAGPPIAPRDGTPHLDTLLAEFCFRTPGDRTNFVAVLLTALLVPRFVGCKPAVLFGGNQPGLGKSVLAQIVSILRDGRATETATYNPNDEEFEKRLGAIVRRGATTIVIDNAKGTGRAARIDSAVLERSITDPMLSFRLLGQSAEIRAENAHTVCITANTPDVSRDLVTRCVLVDLFHEGDPATRTFKLPDPEAYALEHRTELWGELAGMVERWRAAGAPECDARSRFNKKGWAKIVGGILAHAGRPGFLANAAGAAAELDPVRREFGHLVALMADSPQGAWTAAELAALAAREGALGDELRDLAGRGAATRIGMLAGRFVGTAFPLPDGRTATFHRVDGRKGCTYHVALSGTDD